MGPECPPLVDRFRADLPVDPADGAVLALSGGPDSTALLHLFLETGAPPESLVAAHLDHGMRASSRRDAEFVREQARSLSVEFVEERSDVPAEAARTGRGLEETAREMRYRFLARTATKRRIPVVATGHHLDDQAETVLMRILRGTGTEGLKAIRNDRPMPGYPGLRLVRPMLAITGAELVDYLAARGVPFLVDPTNLDGSNRRSLLRTRLIPRLARETPGLARRLSALARRAHHLERDAEPGLREVLLAALPADAPMLDQAAVERARAVVEEGRGIADLVGGWSISVADGELRVILTDEPTAPELELELPCPGSVLLPDGRRLVAKAAGVGNPVPDRLVEVVDADRAPPPYQVRFAAEGDRFRPLGLGTSTTIYRFLMGQGVPQVERQSIPVVWSKEVVVWVVGYRIDERAALTGETTKSVSLTLT